MSSTGPDFPFYLDFTTRQDYFTHFEHSQLLGGVKTEVTLVQKVNSNWELLTFCDGDSEEKPPDHPQAELCLSHVTWARLEPTPVRLRAIVTKISGLNHTATEAAQTFHAG